MIGTKPLCPIEFRGRSWVIIDKKPLVRIEFRGWVIIDTAIMSH